MDEGALYANTRLTRIAKCTDNNTCSGKLQISVTVHNHARIATELERDALAPSLAL